MHVMHANAHKHAGCVGEGCPICPKLDLPGYEAVRRRLGLPARPPLAPWPPPARAAARLRRPGERGVGDTLARLLGRLGAESGLAGALKRAYRAITGRECGCADRQRRLNEHYPYPPP